MFKDYGSFWSPQLVLQKLQHLSDLNDANQLPLEKLPIIIGPQSILNHLVKFTQPAKGEISNGCGVAKRISWVKCEIQSNSPHGKKCNSFLQEVTQKDWNDLTHIANTPKDTESKLASLIKRVLKTVKGPAPSIAGQVHTETLSQIAKSLEDVTFNTQFSTQNIESQASLANFQRSEIQETQSQQLVTQTQSQDVLQLGKDGAESIGLSDLCDQITVNILPTIVDSVEKKLRAVAQQEANISSKSLEVKVNEKLKQYHDKTYVSNAIKNMELRAGTISDSVSKLAKSGTLDDGKVEKLIELKLLDINAGGSLSEKRVVEIIEDRMLGSTNEALIKYLQLKEIYELKIEETHRSGRVVIGPKPGKWTITDKNSGRIYLDVEGLRDRFGINLAMVKPAGRITPKTTNPRFIGTILNQTENFNGPSAPQIMDRRANFRDEFTIRYALPSSDMKAKATLLSWCEQLDVLADVDFDRFGKMVCFLKWTVAKKMVWSGFDPKIVTEHFIPARIGTVYARVPLPTELSLLRNPTDLDIVQIVLLRSHFPFSGKSFKFDRAKITTPATVAPKPQHKTGKPNRTPRAGGRSTLEMIQPSDQLPEIPPRGQEENADGSDFYEPFRS